MFKINNKNTKATSQTNVFIVNFEQVNVMRCAIWYHLYNLKNVKNTHGGVLILAKLQD